MLFGWWTALWIGRLSSCEYTAHFPYTIFDVAGVFRVVSGDGVVVSAASASVAAVYENAGSTFSPDISITVPDIDDDDDGIHDLSGTTIGFSFRTVAGSNNACRGYGSGSESWVVRSNGSVAGLRGFGAVVLVDRLVGASSSCEYTAHFTNTIFDVAGVFRVVSGDGVVVSAASASVAAVYENAGSTFSPDISITVPDIRR